MIAYWRSFFMLTRKNLVFYWFIKFMWITHVRPRKCTVIKSSMIWNRAIWVSIPHGWERVFRWLPQSRIYMIAYWRSSFVFYSWFIKFMWIPHVRPRKCTVKPSMIWYCKPRWRFHWLRGIIKVSHCATSKHIFGRFVNLLWIPCLILP